MKDRSLPLPALPRGPQGRLPEEFLRSAGEPIGSPVAAQVLYQLE